MHGVQLFLYIYIKRSGLAKTKKGTCQFLWVKGIENSPSCTMLASAFVLVPVSPITHLVISMRHGLCFFSSLPLFILCFQLLLLPSLSSVSLDAAFPSLFRPPSLLPQLLFCLVVEATQIDKGLGSFRIFLQMCWGSWFVGATSLPVYRHDCNWRMEVKLSYDLFSQIASVPGMSVTSPMPLVLGQNMVTNYYDSPDVKCFLGVLS